MHGKTTDGKIAAIRVHHRDEPNFSKARGWGILMRSFVARIEVQDVTNYSKPGNRPYEP